jgi:hypothetical protein
VRVFLGAMRQSQLYEAFIQERLALAATCFQVTGGVRNVLGVLV